jgi:hypothetical protein
MLIFLIFKAEHASKLVASFEVELVVQWTPYLMLLRALVTERILAALAVP